MFHVMCGLSHFNFIMQFTLLHYSMKTACIIGHNGMHGVM